MTREVELNKGPEQWEISRKKLEGISLQLLPLSNLNIFDQPNTSCKPIFIFGSHIYYHHVTAIY